MQKIWQTTSLTFSRFYRQLIASGERGATWRLIGSQIVFSRINITTWFGTEENPYNSGYESCTCVLVKMYANTLQYVHMC